MEESGSSPSPITFWWHETCDCEQLCEPFLFSVGIPVLRNIVATTHKLFENRSASLLSTRYIFCRYFRVVGIKASVSAQKEFFLRRTFWRHLAGAKYISFLAQRLPEPLKMTVRRRRKIQHILVKCNALMHDLTLPFHSHLTSFPSVDSSHGNFIPSHPFNSLHVFIGCS